MKQQPDFSSFTILDLHVHSKYSYDSKSEPTLIIKRAEKIGLKGLAITDHNTVDFHNKLDIKTDLLIIPGIEISSSKGHIIGLGIKTFIPPKLSVEATIEKIRDEGGEVIIPHPFDFTRKGIGRNVERLKNIAIETVNAACVFGKFNEKALDYAMKYNLTQTGGSDSHRVQDLAMAYTKFNEDVSSIDDVLESIRKKQTKGEGDHLNIKNKIIRAFQIHF